MYDESYTIYMFYKILSPNITYDKIHVAIYK